MNVTFLKLYSIATCAISLSIAFGGSTYSQEEEKKEEEKKDQVETLEATHKQVKAIRPELSKSTSGSETDEDEAAIAQPKVGGALKTFCLAYDGTILAGLSAGDQHALQFLSPDGDLKQQLDLQFQPQVISQAPDGTIFIAGPGKLAKVSQAGKLLDSVDAPWLGDPEELKKEVIAQMKEQYQGIIDNYQSTLETLNKRIEKVQADLEEKPSKQLEKRLAALEKQRETQESQIEMIEKQLENSTTGNMDALVSQRTSSTGIAANSKDLFVCASGKGFRYEVWRMDHEFKAPELVVDSLSGCCGQCDIQCDEEHLVVAANTEFAVQIRTRDGKNVSKFGQRGGQEGFGSCCNPMNVKVLADGDVLTAESSIGWIKRFNREGELEAVIGKAKIGGGCKHVPIGHNAEMDRYYMLYEDRAEICVLDPIASLKGPTDDEIAANEAKAGLGQKLIGKWKNSEAKKVPARGFFGAIFSSASDDSSSPMPSTVEFKADGGLKTVGGQFGSLGHRWEAVSQQDQVLKIQMVSEDETGFNFEIKFLSDDKAEVKLMMDVHEFGKATFSRVGSEESDAADSEKSEAKNVDSEDSGDEKPKSVKMSRIIPK